MALKRKLTVGFNRNKTGELIVKPRYSPRVKLFVAAVVVVVVLAGAGGIYSYGLTTAGFDLFSSMRQQQGLQQQIDQLKGENRQLQDSLASAQRTLQMDQVAYQDLQQSLNQSAQQMVALRQELDFYRNIISPPNKKAGVRIQSFALQPGAGGAGQYHYKLVLIQALKHDYMVQGRARFQISGMQAGKAVTLQFPGQKGSAIAVSFKYFEDLEGDFALPPDFDPRTITVTVSTYGPNAQTAEETYNWSEIAGTS